MCPASSAPQQRLMGMALAFKRGQFHGKPSAEVKKVAGSMSEGQLHDFAATKGLASGGAARPPKDGVSLASRAYRLASQMAKEQERVSDMEDETHRDAGGIMPEVPYFERGAIRNMQNLDMHPPGLVSGMGPGRTDTVNTKVPSGSYILPADVVSGLGAGHTMYGADVMNRILSSMAPYGAAPPHMGHKAGPGLPAPPKPFNAPGLQNPLSSVAHVATGGDVEDDHEPVDVKLASGEFIVYPKHVKAVGSGDVKKGHDMLDSFVLAVRKRSIQEQKNLPGPKKAHEK